MVDAGTAGANTFGGLLRLMATQRTRMFAFVHISSIGLAGWPVPESRDLDYLDPELAAWTVRQHPDVCLGVKVRQSQAIVGSNGLEPLRRALRAAELAGAGARVMCHIGGAPAPLAEIVALLRPGDIVTHCFTGHPNGMVDEQGRLLPVCRAARAKGILFDVGHGAGSGSFAVMRAAVEAGFLPDTISTDLHSKSVNAPVVDLPTTLSKFLNLGVPLLEVVRCATVNPARIIGRVDGLGTLRVGAPADVAVLELQEGDFSFVDSYGDRLAGRQRLVAVHTIRGGRLWGRPYPELLLE